MLNEESTLFDDMIKKIEENQELSDLLFDLTVGQIKYEYNADDPVMKFGLMDLTVGQIKYEYNADDPVMKFGLMLGFLAKETKGPNGLQIHNKIFEIRITNYFVAKTKRKWRENNIVQTTFNEIVKDNIFDMELCLTKFQKHYSEIYTEKDRQFLERDGKLIFLTYLKPLINGFGFYHFESETRDHGKMDLVIDFLKQQFILEMKLWYGDSKHEAAYRQLADYLKSKNMDCGYLLTFDFRQQRDDLAFHETTWVEWEGKRIFDVVLTLRKNA